jgi:hypothetical protein
MMEKRQSSTSGANVIKHFIIDDAAEKVVRVLACGQLFSAESNIFLIVEQKSVSS